MLSPLAHFSIDLPVTEGNQPIAALNKGWIMRDKDNGDLLLRVNPGKQTHDLCKSIPDLSIYSLLRSSRLPSVRLETHGILHEKSW